VGTENTERKKILLFSFFTVTYFLVPDSSSVLQIAIQTAGMQTETIHRGQVHLNQLKPSKC